MPNIATNPSNIAGSLLIDPVSPKYPKYNII